MPPGSGRVGPALADPERRTVTAPWHPSPTVATTGWPEGDYLLELDTGRSGHRLDLAAAPHLLEGARALLSLGHDEYRTPEMKRYLLAARDNGTNLAFLGANAVYRRVRLAPSPLGRDRVVINYKIAASGAAGYGEIAGGGPGQWSTGSRSRALARSSGVGLV